MTNKVRSTGLSRLPGRRAGPFSLSQDPPPQGQHTHPTTGQEACILSSRGCMMREPGLLPLGVGEEDRGKLPRANRVGARERRGLGLCPGRTRKPEVRKIHSPPPPPSSELLAVREERGGLAGCREGGCRARAWGPSPRSHERGRAWKRGPQEENRGGPPREMAAHDAQARGGGSGRLSLSLKGIALLGSSRTRVPRVDNRATCLFAHV